MKLVVAIAVLLSVPLPIRAGIYYSGEQYADLPSQWRGFLIDQRLLRSIAVKPKDGASDGPERKKYLKEAERLDKDRDPSANDLADLGAIYIRLGDIDKALEVLRAAQRKHPDHFRIAAHLGTAWQYQGNLQEAVNALCESVRLAPRHQRAMEEQHLKLARLRAKQKRDAQSLDDLFGLRYVNDAGKYEPGRITEAERKMLPDDAAAIVQQLALWLPGDPRLLWQMAELANTQGDFGTAAAMMEGCVVEFGMNDPELRVRRQVTKDAAAEQAKSPKVAGHENHFGMKPRSKKPLVVKIDLNALPKIRDREVNGMPWEVVNETSVGGDDFAPSFHKYLSDLDGKEVCIVGFMQPIGRSTDVASFLLVEYPVGCWYCQVPELTGMIQIDLPKEKTRLLTRKQVKVTGTLRLNRNNPENFLYNISGAKVVEDE